MNNRKAKSLASILILAFTVVAIVGCADWERSAYQSLYTSKKVLDKASLSYRTGFIVDDKGAKTPFPQTEKSYQAISKLNDAQAVGARALLVYENLRLAGADKDTLFKAQSDVLSAIAQLPPLLADVKNLVGKGVTP
jgi:hypothetical protein